MGLNPFKSSLETFPPVSCSRFTVKARGLAGSQEMSPRLCVLRYLPTNLPKMPRNESQRMSEITFGGISAQINKSLTRPKSVRNKRKQQESMKLLSSRELLSVISLLYTAFLNVFMKRINQKTNMVSIPSSWPWIKYHLSIQ